VVAAWGASVAEADSTGWVSPTACDEVTDCNVDANLWSGETSATASDDVRAAASVVAGGKTSCLRCLFDHDLPYGSQVTSISARAAAQATISGVSTDLLTLQTGDGDYPSPAGQEHADLPAAVLADSFITVTDGVWISPAAVWRACAEGTLVLGQAGYCVTAGTDYNINHTNLGVLLAFKSANLSPGIVHVDHVQMKVDFKPPRKFVVGKPRRMIPPTPDRVFEVGKPPTIGVIR
jgi:hypothetical protein